MTMLKTPQEIEEWRPVKGVDNHYKVSSRGVLYNLKTGKYIMGHKNKRGYIRVFVRKNGKFKNMPLHRIVIESFLDRPANNYEVNHIDFNKSNNSLSNLEWVTRKQNITHNFLGDKIRYGERCNLSKLTEEKVLTILTFNKLDKKAITLLSKSMSVQRITIKKVLKGLSWKRIYQNAV